MDSPETIPWHGQRAEMPQIWMAWDHPSALRGGELNARHATVANQSDALRFPVESQETALSRSVGQSGALLVITMH